MTVAAHALPNTAAPLSGRSGQRPGGRRPALRQVVREEVVRVRGPLGEEQTARLELQLLEVLASHPDRLVVDLSGCDALDGAGLRLLVQAHQQAQRQGAVLALRAAGPRIRRTLAATGLHEVLRVEQAVR